MIAMLNTTTASQVTLAGRAGFDDPFSGRPGRVFAPNVFTTPPHLLRFNIPKIPSKPSPWKTGEPQ
jgi:hypothetical protein